MDERALHAGLKRPIGTASRATLVVGVILRVVIAFLSIELSGAVHSGLDCAASFGLGEHPEHDYEGGEDHDCPPGCPACHCAHGALASGAIPLEVRFAVVQRSHRVISYVAYHARPPSATDLAPLYRPPRVNASV